MNKAYLIFSLLCITGFLLVGCARKNEVAGLRPSTANNLAQEQIRSMADLRRILTPSLETNQIIGFFGEPRWKEDLGGGRQVWHFSLPPFRADDAMQGSFVSGFSVGITNGRMAKWDCTYLGPISDVPEKQTVLVGEKGQNVSPELQFFTVQRDPIIEGRFVDTERFPKLGFISRTPTLVISRLKEVTFSEHVLSGSQSRTNWSFGIFLTPDDTAKLKSLTATNISARLLIMIGDEPVSAPKIMAPLETGSLVIECQDRSLMESVKRQLAGMERQGQ